MLNLMSNGLIIIWRRGSKQFDGVMQSSNTNGPSLINDQGFNFAKLFLRQRFNESIQKPSNSHF